MPKIKFGVNVNTRVPLIYPEQYPVDKLLDLAASAEERGYHSIWVGDSLLAKPRLDPLITLGAIASKTKSAKLGVACMIAPLRNPMILARAWATLDVVSHGRTIMGVCIGPGQEEYVKLGMKQINRSLMMEEHIEMLHKLWTENNVSHTASHYRIDNITLDPKPVQKPYPPIWVVGWPYGDGKNVDKAVVESVLGRVAKFGEGWMIDGGSIPHFVEEGIGRLGELSKAEGKDPSKMEIVYQLTLNVGPDKQKAVAQGDEYIMKYYGSLKRPFRVFGPAGTADECIKWIEEFEQAGITTIILRFASPDQFGQLDYFTKNVLPSFS